MTAFGQASYSPNVEVIKVITWVIILSFSWQAFAHQPEDGNIHAILGPMMLRTQPIDHDFESPYQGGGALIADADIDYNGGVEISIFYFHQLYSVRQQNLIVTERTQRMYISTGYRHWFNPRFSGALGFFSAYAIGEPQTVRNDFTLNNAPDTSASDTTEYGFDLSLQYEPWHKDRWSIVMDARYAYSVTAKPHEDESFVSFLVGLKYFVQSREEGLH